MAKKRRGKSFPKALISLIIGILASFFIWIADTPSPSASIPQSGEPAVLYSNQAHQDLQGLFKNAIDNAQSSIFLTIYSLSDPGIIAALRKQAERGIDTTIICDAKASPYIHKKLGPSVKTHYRFSPGLMHQKILVVDEKNCWIGSANFTTESLKMHGNLVTGVSSQPLAQALLEKGRSMMDEPQESPQTHRVFDIGDQRLELWFFPDDKGGVKRLQELIRGAQKTIRIAMFTWTRLDLAQAISQASKRGVHVEVVLDNTSAHGASAKVLAFLKKQGVSVKLSQGAPLLHHKFLYIDDAILINGSANWTKAAFTQNDDCFIILQSLNPQQQALMKHVWDVITSESRVAVNLSFGFLCQSCT